MGARDLKAFGIYCVDVTLNFDLYFVLQNLSFERLELTFLKVNKTDQNNTAKNIFESKPGRKTWFCLF